MPQLATRLVQWVLRTTGIYRKMYAGGPGFAALQAKALSVPSAPSEKQRQKTHVNEAEFQGQPVFTLAPKDAEPVLTMLYWHGGGYVYPAADAHWAFLAEMADKYRWRIVAPLYPLAPSHTVEAVTGFAFEFYRHLLDKMEGRPFLMGGDSAGGGLAAATIMAARDAGLPLPERLLLICPWLEANPSHPDQPQIERRDAILTLRGIREAAVMYAGEAGMDDARVSPINGDWSGLPPILAFGGGDDILVTDARALKGKLPSVEYREGQGLIHDWPIFTFAESREAQAAMAAWAAAA